MALKVIVAAAATLALLGSGVAFAQTSAPASKPAAAATTKVKKPRTAKSLDCSKQADEKSLHGKARHKFRAQCMKG